MINSKVSEIREFCIRNSNKAIIEKYSRYFKNGFDGYGIDQKLFEQQRDAWIEQWKKEMDIGKYLNLGDTLVRIGKYEEISFAISFVASERENYSEEAFNRIGAWFDYGIENWATTDVLCMLVLSGFLIDRVVPVEKLLEWTKSESEWKRRAVPVTLVELVRKGLTPDEALPIIEPLMNDRSENVQKGIGTLLRGLWKNHPERVEDFLMVWKNSCGRLIIQYSTEKMDKEYRKKFRRDKTA
jgi:3-methyladenine DNA glycosylase AlkD